MQLSAVHLSAGKIGVGNTGAGHPGGGKPGGSAPRRGGAFEFGPALLVAIAVLLSGCAHRPAVPPPAGPAEPQATGPGYAGFALNDATGGGAVVLGMIAGPAALAGLRSGDRIVSVAGEPAGAARLLAMIQSSAPGTRLPLQVIRDERSMDLLLTVGAPEHWAAPSAQAPRINYVAPPVREVPVWVDDLNHRAADAAPELIPLAARLDLMLGELARSDTGYNKLPLTRLALADPGALVEFERRLVDSLRLPPAPPHTVSTTAASEIVIPEITVPITLAPMLCEVLALDCAGQIREPADESPTLAQFTAVIAEANQSVRSAFAAGSREQLSADLTYLLEQTAASRTLLYQPESRRGFRAMQSSLRVDTAVLLGAFSRLLANAARLPEASTPGNRVPVPVALAAMVEGEILDFAEVDDGYVVIGGPDANRYRMDRLYAVIDVGGDDRYVWGEGLQPETQTIVDLAGNDSYEAGRAGPGAGWLGAAVLIDMAGDDRYASAFGGCGAGAHGFGLLFDAAGADRYDCAAWSAGAGIYGGGVLIDAGSGADAYVSQVLSQGVGGPGGVGVLIDGGGADLYRANGPVPSAYDTPATYMSFSQGVGFGIRPYDHGGFGALIDYGGDDRYEGGEFSQGGGYFWGVGLLHDAAGNDLYYGNRYAQGFAAHQAAGLLSDLGGDDVYWATTAAAQGAAWDQSVAMLFDAGGNDSYRGQSLAQGAAAMQSRAWLYDAQGNDVYWSSLQSAQGAAGDNFYHFRIDDPVLSFGVLLDGQGADRYSSGLADGETRIRHDPENPDRGKDNAGIAIDLESSDLEASDLE